VIRTLDLGGDKQPAFLGPQFEANPNLGIQGLRFSLLASQELFRTQIRALLHVGKDYDVRIMLPMVLGGADLRHAIAIMREVAGEERYATGASPCRHFRVDWYPARFSCVGSDPAGLMQLHRGIDGCR
jgi:phosphoenolpyruvate-protein kinase (PTS system EI component)